MQRWAQVLQDEVSHVGTHPAVPQFSLAGLWRDKGNEKQISTQTGRQDVGSKIQNDTKLVVHFVKSAFVCVEYTIICTS